MNAIESASYWIARGITALAFDLIPTVRVPRPKGAASSLTDTGICDCCETNQPNVETCDHSFTLCETCRDEFACRYCRTEGMTRTWRLT